MTKAPRSWRALWLRRLALGALAVAVAITGFWFLAVPPIVERLVSNALLDAGFREANVRVVSLSVGQVELANLGLGQGTPFRAARVRATFALGDVLRGRVQGIVVEDSAWDLTGAPPGRPLAPFDELVGARAKSAAPGAAIEPLPAVPLTRFELVRCRIRLADSQEIECDGWLETSSEAWRAQVMGRSHGEILAATLALRREGAVASGDVELRLGRAPAPLALTGSIRVTAGPAGRDVALALHGDAREFEVNLGERGVRGRAVALQLAARLSAASEPATGLAWEASLRTGEGGDLALTGEAWPPGVRGLAVLGSLRVRGGSLGEPALLEVSDVVLRSGETWRIEGVNGSVRCTSLVPAATPPDQRLAWRSVRIGEVGARAGTVAFHVRTGPVLVVASARWAVDDVGSMSVSPFELDPRHPEIATTLILDATPLEDWLDLVSQGRVHGSGRLSGQVSARLRFAPLDVEFGEGQLRAVGGGGMRFLDDPATIQLIETYVATPAASAAGARQAEVKQRIVESLKDFEFRQLTFDLVRRDEHLDLRAHVVGKGVTPPHQELDLNVNLNAFDDIVDVALAMKLGFDRAKQRAGGVLTPNSQRRPQ